MALVKSTYGKGRVRVMRIHRDGERHEVRELTVKVMLEGDFARSYTAADNSKAVATDTMKNIVNICARKHANLATEAFCQAVAKISCEHYAQIEKATVTGVETKWTRLACRRQAARAQFRARQQRKAVRQGHGHPHVHGDRVRHRGLHLHEVHRVGLGPTT